MVVLKNGNTTINGEVTANSIKIPNGTASQYLMADGSVSTGGAGGSSTTVGVIDQASNANGAVINNGVLSLTPADADNGGVVTTGEQTFAGSKNFSSDLNVNGIKVGKGNANEIFSNAIGVDALNAITSGQANVALGYQSQLLNTSGSFNSSIGAWSQWNNITGARNTSVGCGSLKSNTTGSKNTIVGVDAASESTTGDNNTVFGEYAFKNNITGSYNTVLGNQSDVSTDGLINATAIGYSAIVDASNKIQLGNTDVTSVNTSGTYTGAGFKTPNGTASEFLMADGTTSFGPSLSGLVTMADLSGYATTLDLNTETNRAAAAEYNIEARVDVETNRALAAEQALDNKIYFRDATDFPGSIYSSNPGNVGIGTGLPSEKLDVNGNLKVRQNATITGTINGLKLGTGSGTGDQNLAVSDGSALSNNGIGRMNLAIGNVSLASNTTGSYNVGYGPNTLASNSSGEANIALGMSGLYSNNTGSNNAVVGINAFFDNVSGSGNTALGSETNVIAGDLNNATAIGYGAVVDASNKIQLGNGGVTSVNTSGTYTGAGFKTPTGTASQFLMANGSTTTGSVVSSTAQSFAGDKTFSGNVITNGNVIISNPTNAAINTTATATAANLLTGYITSTTVAAVNITLPTASAIATAIGGTVANGTSLEFSVYNSGSTNAVTLVVGTGITVQTTPVITGSNSLVIAAAAKMGHFRLVFTSATTAMLFRIY